MRSYMIQDIKPADIHKITSHLQETGYKNPLDGLFWLPLPRSLWASDQEEHSHQCGPYYLALELGPDWLRLEFLVRSEQRLRCDCIKYADSRQREAMMEFLDQLIRNRDIAV
ncbi:hypothetical protein [Desulfonatronospira sp.]|uniref:hypothetical protein n=1 Tax=Desulfonatronospira sp. TaxID=1962951 RepID=UPI0025C2D024|nr:hypothetical protein [Desulfonatronospira sp.]